MVARFAEHSKGLREKLVVPSYKVFSPFSTTTVQEPNVAYYIEK